MNIEERYFMMSRRFNVTKPEDFGLIKTEKKIFIKILLMQAFGAQRHFMTLAGEMKPALKGYLN
jgi:hypothetical protein